MTWRVRNEPSLFKRFLHSAAATRAASALITNYLRAIDATSRLEFRGRQAVEPLIGENRGVILAYWHQRLFLGALLRRQTDRRVFQLSSHHRDAEIIAQAVKPFGVEFIRGSAADPRKAHKDKGGAGAAAQMIGALKEGHLVAITPDGPRGPARRAHVGILRLAQLSGAPILPGAYAASNAVHLDTWDDFLLPLPFGRAIFVAGRPIFVPPDARPDDLAALRRDLEAALDLATAAADEAAGRSRIADQQHIMGK